MFDGSYRWHFGQDYDGTSLGRFWDFYSRKEIENVQEKSLNIKSLRQLLGRTVDDRDFSGIKQPKLLGDVLIMPGNSFAAR